MFHEALQAQRDGTRDGWSGRGSPGLHPPGSPESGGDQRLIDLGGGGGWEKGVGGEEKGEKSILMTVEGSLTAGNVLTHLLWISWYEQLV